MAAPGVLTAWKLEEPGKPQCGPSSYRIPPPKFPPKCRLSQAYLRLLIGEIGGNSTKRPFRLPLDIATKPEKWIQSSNTAGSLPDLAITKTIDEVIVYHSDCMWA